MVASEKHDRGEGWVIILFIYWVDVTLEVLRIMNLC